MIQAIHRFMETGDFIPLVIDGLVLLAGVMVGGWMGYRWKLLENRAERLRAFRVSVDAWAEQVKDGNPWKAGHMHEALAPRLREAALNVQGDLWPWQRKKLEAAWKDFVGIARDELDADLGGQTREEKRLATRRGLDLMEGKLRGIRKLV